MQALSLKEAEKTVLLEKVSGLQADLSALSLEAERTAREAAQYKEQEQVRTGEAAGTSTPTQRSTFYFIFI